LPDLKGSERHKPGSLIYFLGSEKGGNGGNSKTINKATGCLSPGIQENPKNPSN